MHRGLVDSVTPLHMAFLNNHETAKITTCRWKTASRPSGRVEFAFKETLTNCPIPGTRLIAIIDSDFSHVATAIALIDIVCRVIYDSIVVYPTLADSTVKRKMIETLRVEIEEFGDCFLHITSSIRDDDVARLIL